MWVLKLGGSLARSLDLPRWLHTLADHGGGRIILVPGGGPFAEAVRHAQQRWRFADGTAHQMALLAMDQYGWMLAGMEPRLMPAQDRDELLDRLQAGHIPVWLPSGMVGAREDIPTIWELTSDSLAAWLALELQAEHLLLIKAVAPDRGKVWVGDLSARGIVDTAFPSYLARGQFTAWWLGSGSYREIAPILEGDKAPGTEIVARELNSKNERRRPWIDSKPR
jgi:aspartokinase-like uncharacterized kinase